MKPKLYPVPDTPEEPVDIQALNRATILKRDWSACHVNGDRGPVVCWQTRVRRWWRG